MCLASAHRHRRRLLALMQLLLFVFSTSTSLLPCASMDAKAMDAKAMDAKAMANASAHTVAPTADATAMDGHDMAMRMTMPMTTPLTTPTDDASAVSESATPDAPSHHAPGRPMSPTTCPWVVGCVGVMQFAVDTSWHLVERATPPASPVGATLRATFADRDVERRPPRA